jgi:hypothetical protein
MPNSISKKIVVLILSITSIIVAVPVFAEAVSSVPDIVTPDEVLKEERAAPTTQRWMFPSHEKLVYRLKWLGITAGEITMEMNGPEEWRGRKAYRIEVHAKTRGICSTIYRIDDRYVSYLDAEEFHALRHEVYRREGNYKKDAITDFDQAAHKAYFKNLTDGSHKVYKIPPHTQDPVTAAYYVRFLPLEPGRTFDLRVANSERNYEMFLKIGDRAQRSAMGKSWNAYHFEPYAKHKGELVRVGRLSGYISTDNERMPILFVIKAPVFTSVAASLVKVEH